MKDNYLPPLGLDYYKNLNQYQIDLAFLFAVGNKEWSLSNFLLNDPRVPFNANIHGIEDSAFKFALMDKDKERLEYLIFELNIAKTSRVKEILDIFMDETASSNEAGKLANSLFQNRDLNKELKTELGIKGIDNKAHKL